MVEPQRISLYEVLNKSLKLAGRRTFLHRYIYVGQHVVHGDVTLENVMREIINAVNGNYCDEHLTGLLLFYPQYFVHIIDGSDISLNKHFIMLYNKYEHFLGHVKLITRYHHINQRFFHNWNSVSGKPPLLLEKIDVESDFEETKRYVNMCVTKVYNLALALRQPSEEDDNFIEVGEIKPEMGEYLPEYSLLDFLMKTQYLIAVKKMQQQFYSVAPITYYTEKIFPIRGDFIPYDIFVPPADLAIKKISDD